MSKKIVTFGEIMLRLSVPCYKRFPQANSFNVSFGGSEANVAVSLANFGLHSEFLTCLPPNLIGKACLNELHRYGVHTPHVVTKPGRMGLYYMEEAVAMRSSQVVYDRAGTSFDSVAPGDIDWEEVLAPVGWFHFSGITPAVASTAADACLEAVTTARRLGLTVSCDINFRRNLWTYGKQPIEVMPELLAHCDVVFGTELEYKKALGIDMPGFKAVDTDYRMDLDGYARAAEDVNRLVPQCTTIVFALRNTLGANHHLLGGTLWRDGCLHVAKIYNIDDVKDCVGCGDAYVAGIIYGMTNGRDAKESLALGAAACALKNTFLGDFSQTTAEELENCI
ncbi:MAG: sugar kinase [Bacteroidales bacterium]|nr:sugar kinase [Bacteroidales bacterium]